MERKMKTVFVLILAIAMTIMTLTTGCSSKQASNGGSDGKTSISLWLYPIGSFSDKKTVDSFISKFNEQEPDIEVRVDYLDYVDGDEQVSAAIEEGTTPDVIMEGPERLVANWGAKGEMADIGDLWTDSSLKDINNTSSVIANACMGADGKYYEYPLCITAHCMAINYEVFQKAGALKYIDLKNRTWSTADFIKACRAVRDSGLVQTPGVVYCGGQGGDQGTRALVTNFYGASFTNSDHTKYMINQPKGIKALNKLYEMSQSGLLSSNGEMVASDELKMFASGTTAMTFAWNASNQKVYAANADFTPYVMAFPTDSGKPKLCSGIWGFGIFDNKDAARKKAAEKLIRFLCDDEEQAPISVRATGLFPVKSSLGDVYYGTDDEERMSSYSQMMNYIGDYYNITPGWTAQRTAWWTMLQQVFTGTDPKAAADKFVDLSNKAAE